ncbi:MAG: hypothetical protein HC800_24140 [Phormidesmis sp. RL_2_1]|nr:hypothetical protein [Phormidesmis sp. RL_2_1]
MHSYFVLVRIPYLDEHSSTSVRLKLQTAMPILGEVQASSADGSTIWSHCLW